MRRRALQVKNALQNAPFDPFGWLFNALKGLSEVLTACENALQWRIVLALLAGAPLSLEGISIDSSLGLK